MDKPIIEKLRDFTNGFEHYTLETSQYYANECEGLDDLLESIDDNLTIAERDWDTRQIWRFNENNDLEIGTITGYNEEEEVPTADAFCRILLPDRWK